jgi:Leucine-rich repeat (LRR) protein
VELKRLNFSGNLLKTIPTEIMGLNKLEVLLLEDNPLESIPEGVVSNLIRQECEIRVSNNKQYLLVLSKY